MSERFAYERKIEAMLTEWPERIAFMERRTHAIPETRRVVYTGLVERMRETYAQTRRHLDEYRSANDSAWPQAQKTLERSWNDLASAYEKALCQFEGVKN